MSTALAEVVVESTLEELAEIANRETELAEGAEADARAAVLSAIEHHLTAGKALRAAKDHPDMEGRWESWVEASCVCSLSHANNLIRLAVLELAVRKHSDFETLTLREALRRTRGLAAVSGPRVKYDDGVRAVVRQLHNDGWTPAQVEEHTGVTRDTVKRWTDRDYAKRKRANQVRHEQDRQRGAALRYERHLVSAVRREGKDVAKAFAAVRTALQALSRAEAQADNPQHRRLLDESQRDLYRCVDKIGRLLGAGPHPQQPSTRSRTSRGLPSESRRNRP